MDGKPIRLAAFCLAFDTWLLLVRLVRHFIGVLPGWFKRGDVTAGHQAADLGASVKGTSQQP